ncbi:MAG: hypothetical protein Q8J89_00185 [Caulobacter sp.]|nr:hypothetical protein [Caulobacter sp.]
MTTLRNTLAATLLLALAACGQSASEPPAAPAEPIAAAPPSGPAPVATGQASVALDAGGLLIVMKDTGSTRMIDFGLPKDQTVAIVTNVAGAPAPESTNSECGAGPVQFIAWPDGLTLLFQEDRFAGWSVDKDAAGKQSTMSGVGVGATRSDLVAAYSGVQVSETSLGQEFSAGGLYGVLDGSTATAKIEVMWAGVSCVFR